MFFKDRLFVLLYSSLSQLCISIDNSRYFVFRVFYFSFSECKKQSWRLCTQLLAANTHWVCSNIIFCLFSCFLWIAFFFHLSRTYLFIYFFSIQSYFFYTRIKMCISAVKKANRYYKPQAFIIYFTLYHVPSQYHCWTIFIFKKLCLWYMNTWLQKGT